MILDFPNLDTLRLALISGIVPDSVSLAPVAATFGDQGTVRVRSSAPVPAAALTELRRLGVQVAKDSAEPLVDQCSCWPQLLPLARTDSAVTDKTPVLFELAESQVPELVAEVLRLGNDRQAYRWLTAQGRNRALLRVIGPPYYSLLRALDSEASGGRQPPGSSPCTAYVEAAPRVWIVFAHTHPLAEQLKPPSGKLLLIRPPREWLFIEEGKFHDIYEMLEFPLATAPVQLREAELPSRLSVPLRLARGAAAEPAELWVLRQGNIEQIETLVRNADDQLVSRLAFAAGTRDGKTSVVLRVRPSKLPPPVLVLDAVGFRPYLRLPNLFLPCDARLHPPLRRDIVRKLLASDADAVTWLYPQSEGGFVPERLPETAFRPMAQWVDYILDQEHQPLEAWVQSTRFDFESFICPDEQIEPARKVAQPTPREPVPRPTGPADEPDGRAPVTAPDVKVVKKTRRKARNDESVSPPAMIPPSEAMERLRKLEDRFQELTSPLDAADRRHLWAAMAPLNAALGHAADAAVCWVNALWEPDAPPGWLLGWLQTESKSTAEPLTAAALDTLLNTDNPEASGVRLLAVALVCTADRGATPELSQRLGRCAQFLEKHEALLPVRAAWLAWLAMVKLSGGDVLALARARDRLLERLYRQGMSPELDLPGFLRFAGMRGSDRLRGVRDHVLRFRALARKWVGAGAMAVPLTAEYVDLLFAFGLARLGEASECHKLLQSAQQGLFGHDEVHTWLVRAYEHRVRQALEARVAAGRLPDELLERLGQMDRLPRYKIDRLREHSRILEPHEKIDPYRRWHGRFADDLSRQLALLFDVDARTELADRLRKLLLKGPKKADAEPRILATALELAPRLGEAFAREVLDRVPAALDQVKEPLDRSLLLEKGLFLAAHFDQATVVQGLIGRFLSLLDTMGADGNVQALESLLGPTFRGLRKLGMRDETDQLLRRLAHAITGGQDLDGLRARHAKKGKTQPDDGPWARTLRLLLHVAAGWLYFGREEQAQPVLDQVRDVLFKGDLVPVQQTALACAYGAALGQARPELALPRLEELLRRLERVHDTYTTNSHYSLSRLDLAEAVVLALVSDAAALDPTGRRHLDADEFLVRRRIHRDVREVLARSAEH